MGVEIRTRNASFGFFVGEGRFWVRDPFAMCDPNHGMGLMFGFVLLEIV